MIINVLISFGIILSGFAEAFFILLRLKRSANKLALIKVIYGTSLPQQFEPPHLVSVPEELDFIFVIENCFDGH